MLVALTDVNMLAKMLGVLMCVIGAILGEMAPLTNAMGNWVDHMKMKETASINVTAANPAFPLQLAIVCPAGTHSMVDSRTAGAWAVGRWCHVQHKVSSSTKACSFHCTQSRRQDMTPMGIACRCKVHSEWHHKSPERLLLCRTVCSELHAACCLCLGGGERGGAGPSAHLRLPSHCVMAQVWPLLCCLAWALAQPLWPAGHTVSFLLALFDRVQPRE